MVELINDIDARIDACISGVTKFGLCHLLTSDNALFPATVAMNATQAIPNDKYAIMTYHRLLNDLPRGDIDLSFGKRRRVRNEQKIRLVVFVKWDKTDTHDEVIDNIINALPDNFEVSGYDLLSIPKDITLIRDRATIWNDEYSKDYQDRYKMKFHIYAVEYELHYVKCAVCA